MAWREKKKPVVEDPIERIAKMDVLEILDLRKRQASVSETNKQLGKQLETLEAKVIHQLKRRCPLEPGCPSCAIHVDKKRTPKYKDEILKRLGKEVLQEIIAATPEKETESLVITEP